MAKESSSGFSAAERAAMKERARELKSVQTKAANEALVLEKIAAMAPADKALAERIHAIVKEVAPHLEAKTWYGMQAYFKDGKVVVFFQDGGKFQSRYCTLGFQDAAKLDDGKMWPTSFALIGLDKATEKRIAELVRQAAS
ncbi:MAG: hypothetical protein RLZZ576_274 [Actinomycetota bacterium]|jgi:uncharacterized protein YdhG (YjbR/CyaY superfamily)